MQAIDFYKALSDDTRLRCLLLLQQQGELCVCEFIEALELSQPKISRHLALLKKQNLVVTRKQGQWVFYSINNELPLWCLSTIKLTLENQLDYIQNNVTLLEAMGDRPSRKQLCC
ncbi:metalloregulator ArsR/SmtB family transcription factor [Paraferrimonas sp. SM1919]|uniref:metalloregulator ArsR/SmtB family transcription factor n=1 Tax=Paraferrimonas sp. SM1919 TaxID=2662263 RepID=UPI0013D819FE|nr:metalloregulator ArsR/SmtB family transcription factor [Paraferrimonas sp. SM1919]